VTRNREYHTRAGVCVAVRDRESLAWIAGHRAMGLPLTGVCGGMTILGSQLEFAARTARVRTSSVVDILRPHRNTVTAYQFVLGLAP
jgi:hypothetical protein